MNLKFFISLCALSFVSAFSSYAQEGSIKKDIPGHHIDNMAKDLNLTPEQKTKVEAIHKAQDLDVKSAIEELKIKMKAYEEVFINEKSVDEDIVRAKDDMTKAHKKIEDLHFKTILEIRKVLNFEQRKKFVKHMPGMNQLKKN